MSIHFNLDDVFPEGISDETAAAVGEVLAELLMWWDSAYLDQIRRHHSGQRNLYDPEEPWRSPPKGAGKKAVSR